MNTGTIPTQSAETRPRDPRFALGQSIGLANGPRLLHVLPAPRGAQLAHSPGSARYGLSHTNQLP